ncbi:MAG: hypothetical protein WAK93_04015 [Solirubrobacteraceae bacterium]
MPTELDLKRLQALQEALEAEPAEIAATLQGELERALAQIDAALQAGDMPMIVEVAHAARNSALVIDARPVLADLGELEGYARRGDPEGAASARKRLGDSWQALRARLAEIAAKTAL